jgi:HEPN domain-containing protein
MTNQEMARLDFDRAEAIAGEARQWVYQGRWNLAVRRSQEAVELALKAALRWAGLEVPHRHDVGGLLKRYQHRFPAWFGERTAELAAISGWLRGERERSFYGDEESGLPPEMLYTEHDAAEALEKAALVLNACRQLLEGGGG